MNRWLGIDLMLANGRLEEARALLDEWRTDTPEHPWVLLETAFLYAVEGRRSESLSIVARLLGDEQQRSVFTSDALAPLGFAEFYALIGETDEALEWLELGLELGFINYPALAEKNPYLENLRGDQRFQKLMVRVKKEWEEFEG